MSQTEGKYTAEFLVSEAEGSLSRDNVTVTVAASTKLSPGHVLAKLAATGVYVEYDNSGTDGSQAAAGVLYNELNNSANGSPANFSAVVINAVAEVRSADLTWFSGASSGDKTAGLADLAALFIKAR